MLLLIIAIAVLTGLVAYLADYARETEPGQTREALLAMIGRGPRADRAFPAGTYGAASHNPNLLEATVADDGTYVVDGA